LHPQLTRRGKKSEKKKKTKRRKRSGVILAIQKEWEWDSKIDLV